MSSSRQRKRHAHSEVARSQTNGVTPQKWTDPAHAKRTSPVVHDEPSNAITIITHSTLLIFYGFVHVWGAMAMKGIADIKELSYNFNPLRLLVFVTIQNLYIQTGYCALAVTSDLMPTSKLRTNLKQFCNFIFTTVAFPVAMVVTIGYWALLMADRRNLYDEKGEMIMEHIGPALNHCWHTVVGIAVLLEVILIKHHHTSHRVAITTIFLYNFAYTMEVLFVHYVADQIPYPFLRALGVGGMMMFFLLVFPVILVFYYMGRILSHLRWGYTKCV